MEPAACAVCEGKRHTKGWDKGGCHAVTDGPTSVKSGCGGASPPFACGRPQPGCSALLNPKSSCCRLVHGSSCCWGRQGVHRVCGPLTRD